MGTMTINGKTYKGNKIEVINNKVWIDGKLQDDIKGDSEGEIRVVVIEGMLENLKADGSVNAGDIRGNVAAGGSVNCDGVGGNVSAGGSVNCDDIGGNVSAGGSIRHG